MSGLWKSKPTMTWAYGNSVVRTNPGEKHKAVQTGSYVRHKTGLRSKGRENNK